MAAASSSVVPEDGVHGHCVVVGELQVHYGLIVGYPDDYPESLRRGG